MTIPVDNPAFLATGATVLGNGNVVGPSGNATDYKIIDNKVFGPNGPMGITVNDNGHFLGEQGVIPGLSLLDGKVTKF